MYSIISTAIIQGIHSRPVFVEADVSEGMPLFEMVGFLASEVKESKERVRTALKNSGFVLPPKRITINFTPANIRKSGSAFDLPIAVAVLTALGFIKNDEIEKIFIIGEVGLDGRIQQVRGVLPMIVEARERGITSCIIPAENQKEAMLVSGIKIYGVDHIKRVAAILNGEETDCPQNLYYIEEKGTKKQKIDFSDINGQRMVKRACEVAVSGMHNLLMIGPPGAGKTMVALRIPTILPPLEEEEQMEISKIYSVCGLLEKQQGLMSERPFRAPHHTITAQGLAGGGGVPKPGEISLAHKGVLFLDELPEFEKNALEILRQPMEEKKISLVRLHGNYDYPADFLFVAAMNPCKCGYYPNMQKCTCTRSAIEKYVGRISRPLLDRIDICVETPQIPFEELKANNNEENSKTIRERVIRTHQIQKERYRGEDFCCNSQIPSTRIGEFCRLKDEDERYMERIYKKLNLTARSYHKILKVARTIADMEEAEKISTRHLNEAVCYRSMDKKFWEGGK